MNLNEIENRIIKIEERNKRVELDKAWEISFQRKLLIFILTYLTIGLFMSFINVDRPFLNAIVPSLGFLFSTLSIPLFKNIWIKSQKKF
ncbi:MAG TPA: hypothetical protein VI795_00020 [Patescibacteria group bacterium]|nr:hypothetical protein [Patescibacteria group bacterium]